MVEKVIQLPDPEQRSRQADAVPVRFAGDGCIVYFPNFAERRREREALIRSLKDGYGLTVDEALAIYGDSLSALR